MTDEETIKTSISGINTIVDKNTKARVVLAMKMCYELVEDTPVPKGEVFTRPDLHKNECHYFVVTGFTGTMFFSEMMNIVEKTNAYGLSYLGEKKAWVFMYAPKLPTQALKTLEEPDETDYSGIAHKMAKLKGTSLLRSPTKADYTAAESVATRLIAAHGCDFSMKIVFENIKQIETARELTIRLQNPKNLINVIALQDEPFSKGGYCNMETGSIVFTFPVPKMGRFREQEDTVSKIRKIDDEIEAQ